MIRHLLKIWPWIILAAIWLLIGVTACVLLAGCSVRDYRHDTLDSTGKVTQTYRLTIIDGCTVSNTNKPVLHLADGTDFSAVATTQTADPGVVGAVQGFLAAMGASILKFLGL